MKLTINRYIVSCDWLIFIYCEMNAVKCPDIEFSLKCEWLWWFGYDLCYIEPETWGDEMELRNTVVFIGSFIMDWIRFQNKDDTSMELSKVISQILKLFFFMLSHFSQD